MPAVINTNIASLNSQRNLNSSQSALQVSLQRLSSGLRINSAKDDAAGLAISERFSTQIRGLNQATRNANDGISLAQTGEGALASVTDNLQRIRELAVQAANSTNSADDRAAIQLEVTQRLAEIDRAAAQTSFNGQKLLDGSFTSAAFQIGANAGETITVDGLDNGVRLTATGQVARATSGAIASGASDGQISVTPVGTAFGIEGGPATAGQIDLTFSTNNFAAAVTYVAGTSAAQAVTDVAHDFSQALVPATAAKNQQADSAIDTTGAADFLTAVGAAGGAAAHFDLTDDTGTYTIALDDDDYASSDVGFGLMAAAITAKLSAQGSNTTAAWVSDVADTSGHFVFTSGETGLASVEPVLSNIGADLVALGLADAQVAGADATPTGNATMTIDGTTVTLNQNNANQADVVDDLNAAMDAASLTVVGVSGGGTATQGYLASVVDGNIVITNNTGGTNTTAVAIENVDANAAAAGFANAPTGVTGTAASAGNPASLKIGGTVVNLNSNYGSYAALASTIEATLGDTDYTASADEDTGVVTIVRNTTGVTSTAIDVTDADANANLAITEVTVDGGGASGTAGADAIATTYATFYVDGNAVTLDQNYDDQDAVAADIADQLAGYTADYDTTVTGQITIQKTGSLAAVDITGADANATAAGFAFGSGVAGTSSGSVTLASGELTVAGTAIAADTYDSIAALATYINSNASKVFASEGTGADAGKLVLTSSDSLTLGGTQATGTLGFSGTSFTATNGSLADASVSTVADANLTIQRIDAALNSVSNLRSTFGAVQNRFESVISSLTATSENLTAARSRIQDTDFAAETAQLTRNQILQQAGTAMLAQANQLPNTVLTLLR